MRLDCSLYHFAQSLLSLGLTPLAVAPKHTTDSSFCGKNPSYITADGQHRLIQHSKYQTALPTEGELDQWFSHTDGIGVLCSDTIVCIDVDAKNFSSVAECEEFVERWIDAHNIRSGWIERSRSGGYHIFVRLSKPKDFTNFRFDGFDHHCGEVIGKGRFVVIAPTEGYRLVSSNRNLIEIDSLESIGILPSSKRTAPITPTAVDCRINDDGITTVIRKSILESISSGVKGLLEGTIEVGSDRSTAVTKVAKELYGWDNHFRLSSITPTEDVDSLIERFAYRIGYSIEKLKRTLQTIDRVSCRPSIEVYGVWEPPFETVEANVEAFIKTNSERFRYNVLTQNLEFDGKPSTTKSAVIALREYMTSVAADKRKVAINQKDMEDMMLSYAVDYRSSNPIEN